MQVLGDPGEQTVASRLPPLVVVSTEEGGHSEVAEKTQRPKRLVGRNQILPFVERRHPISRIEDPLPEAGRGPYSIGDLFLAEHHLLHARLPVKAADALLRQADQRIAVLQGVVEEGEGMVLRQRRQPQRQLAEVHRHRVLVHAVQAALGDQAASVQQFVLVRRNVLRDAIVRVPRRH